MSRKYSIFFKSVLIYERVKEMVIVKKKVKENKWEKLDNPWAKCEKCIYHLKRVSNQFPGKFYQARRNRKRGFFFLQV